MRIITFIYILDYRSKCKSGPIKNQCERHAEGHNGGKCEQRQDRVKQKSDASAEEKSNSELRASQVGPLNLQNGASRTSHSVYIRCNLIPHIH